MAIDLQVLDRKAAADNEINWVTAIFMGLFHVGAIAALFFFSWKALLVSMFLWWVSGSLGIGMGYHRLHTHRSYKVPLGLEYFFAICGALTLEGAVDVASLRTSTSRPSSPLPPPGSICTPRGPWDE